MLKLTRARFEEMIDNILQGTIEPSKRAMRDASVAQNDIKKVVLVGGSTHIPKVVRLVRDLFGREPSRSVNPQEVVALGAAVQGGVLGGEVKEVLLLDVVPLSLGLETFGGVFTKMIERNTTIPICKSRALSVEDRVPVVIRVYQGERAMARDNRFLGALELAGVRAGSLGSSQIEVTFDIDVNGILKVSAKDLATGKQQKTTITSSSGLSAGEINARWRDAEAHLIEDSRRLERIDPSSRAAELGERL